MSAAGVARVEPLVWPPSAGVDQRWLARATHALAVELEACWRAHELVRVLHGELEAGCLADRMQRAASAGVVVDDTSQLIELLDGHAPGAGSHLRAASESRRRALGALRDLAWLARRGLLDRSAAGPVLGEVIAELAAAGCSIVAADRALLSDGGCRDRLADANRLTACYAPTEQE